MERISGWDDEKEERARAIAEAALATAIAREASETEAIRDLDRAIRKTTSIAAGRIQTPKPKAADSRVTPDTRVADGANRGARCGVCMRELATPANGGADSRLLLLTRLPRRGGGARGAGALGMGAGRSWKKGRSPDARGSR